MKIKSKTYTILIVPGAATTKSVYIRKLYQNEDKTGSRQNTFDIHPACNTNALFTVSQHITIMFNALKMGIYVHCNGKTSQHTSCVVFQFILSYLYLQNFDLRFH